MQPTSLAPPDQRSSGGSETPGAAGRARPRRVREAGAGGSLGHRNDIQGLRAVAVLLVVLGHAGMPFLRGGFIGVDVFFVLSGFLITGILLAAAAKHGSISLREFYARRAKRILPAAALTLVVTDLVAYRLLNVVRAKQAVLDSVWSAFFAANVQFARQGVDYFSRGQPPSPTQHYWSLAVEEQFYLIWPLLLSVVLVGAAVLWRRGRRSGGRAKVDVAPALPLGRVAIAITVLGLASLAWSIRSTPRSPQAAYFSTAARAWELALGAALAVGASRFVHLSDRTRSWLGWTGLAAIGAGAVLFSEATRFPGSAALLPTVGTALVIAAGIGKETSPRGVGGFLGHPALCYIGDRSYAFYLWHWPVLIIGAGYVGHELSLMANMVLLAGAFLLSIISYRLVENPIRRARVQAPVRATGMLWGTSVGVVVLVAVFSLRWIDASISSSEALAAGPPPTFAPEVVSPVSAGGTTEPEAPRVIPEVIAAVEAARRGAPLPSVLIPPPHKVLTDRYDFPSQRCFADIDNGTDRIAKICPMGDLAASRTIVVFGDSHAREWMPGILWLGTQDHWKVIPLIELGCGPVEYETQCAGFVDWVLRQMKAIHPDVVIIGGHVEIQTETTRERSVTGTQAMVDAMKPLAGQVVVIEDPPQQYLQPVDCLLGRGATMATCTTTLTRDQVSVVAAVGRAVKSRGAIFLPTKGWFCHKNQCPMVVGNTLTYRDNDHVTLTYALELREVFRAAFARAVTE